MTTRHLELARAWARWNGQSGTKKQALAISTRLSADTLTRMLAARGVTVESIPATEPQRASA